MTTMDIGEARITHGDAERLGIHVYDRLVELLDDLRDDEWSNPTECDGWDVAAMVGHMIGAAESHVSKREMVRQYLIGFRTQSQFGGNALDAVNDLQVREHADLSPTERLARLRELAPAAVRSRVRTPALMGRLPVPLAAGAGSLPEGLASSVSLRHLNDVILTRDVFLHRVDIARATARDPRLDDHDAEIVADVVAEWADTHGQPFTLELTGPGGGTFSRAGGPQLTIDTVEFCRTVSGRCPADGLLLTPVLF